MARLIPWAVALLIALVFLCTNLPWTLDDYDQAKQAFTSFEMVEQGHWFYQHTPNERIATKPPLVGWVSAALFTITRSWELAWRVPSLLSAAALALFLTKAAQRAYGATAALLAIGAFGLNMLSPRLATLVRTDMPLALVVFLLGLVIWEKVRSAQPWTSRDRWMLFGLLTAAMLIKGPIVYAFLLPGLIFCAWWKGAAVWCGWWPWIASFAVFLLWVGCGIAFMPGFYEQVVLREFAGRFGETVHRPQPIYFYIPHLLYKFAPWSVLMLGLAWLNRQERLSSEMLWLVCWSFGGVLLMSLIPSKRVDRIFPVIPPLCLLLAAQARNLTPQARRWSMATLAIGCLVTSGYAAEKVISGYRNDQGALVAFGKNVRAQAKRFELVGGREEGLLLYLRRTRFLKRDEAIAAWHSGAVDALVIPSEELPQFPDAAPPSLRAARVVNGGRREYLLLARPTPP